MAHTKVAHLAVLASSARNSGRDLRIFTLPFKSARTLVLLIIVFCSSAFSRKAKPWHTYYQLTIIDTNDGRLNTHLTYNGRQPKLIKVCVCLVTQVDYNDRHEFERNRSFVYDVYIAKYAYDIY